jgi:hypothetical protein
MATDLVSVNIPQSLYQRLEQTANRLQKPVENLLVETLQAALPVMEEIPPYIQAEVASLDSLDETALREITLSEMAPEDQEALEQLLDLQMLQPLTSIEENRLAELRTEYGRILLRKARAFALLAGRGQPLDFE